MVVIELLASQFVVLSCLRLDVLPLARVGLRSHARGLEEIAVLLDDAGHVVIPDELRKMSGRLLEIVDAIPTGRVLPPGWPARSS
jgi:hypothetical protein